MVNIRVLELQLLCHSVEQDRAEVYQTDHSVPGLGLQLQGL